MVLKSNFVSSISAVRQYNKQLYGALHYKDLTDFHQYDLDAL